MFADSKGPDFYYILTVTNSFHIKSRLHYFQTYGKNTVIEGWNPRTG